MIDKIIEDIQQTMKVQEVTEQWLAEKTQIPQSTIHRLVKGKNKKLDLSKIRTVQAALGIVSESAQAYGVTAVHRSLSPQEENLLKALEEMPDIREAVEAMMKLPPRKQKIHLGEILKDLDKLEEEKGKG